MIIYLCCAGGATSSLFCKKIQDACTQENDRAYFADITTIITNLNNKTLLPDDYDIILAYGAAQVLSERYILESKFNQFFNAVYISPQVRFLSKNLTIVCDKFNIPCYPIDSMLFGRMEGGKFLRIMKENQKNNPNHKS